MQSLNQLRRRRSRGFSLLEILIVIAIIGMLAGAVIMNVGGAFGGAQKDTARIFVNSIETPMMQYRLHMGAYPTNEQGLKALRSAPADAGRNWQGPYVKEDKDMVDPWKKDYNYLCPGKNNTNGYDVWSNGPDGQSGTADDIGNWKSASGN